MAGGGLGADVSSRAATRWFTYSLPLPAWFPFEILGFACPITVKKALSKVEGVSKTDVTFEKRQAVVTFDDSKTTIKN